LPKPFYEQKCKEICICKELVARAETDEVTLLLTILRVLKQFMFSMVFS